MAGFAFCAPFAGRGVVCGLYRLNRTKPLPKVTPRWIAQVTKTVYQKFATISGVAFEELVASRKSAMTVAQVAEILSVSQRLIYQLVAAGEVPHFRIGAAVRFEPKTLSAWLNEKLQASSKSLRSRADGRNPQTRSVWHGRVPRFESLTVLFPAESHGAIVTSPAGAGACRVQQRKCSSE